VKSKGHQSNQRVNWLREGKDRETNLDKGGLASLAHAPTFAEVLEEGLVALLRRVTEIQAVVIMERKKRMKERKQKRSGKEKTGKGGGKGRMKKERKTKRRSRRRRKRQRRLGQSGVFSTKTQSSIVDLPTCGLAGELFLLYLWPEGGGHSDTESVWISQFEFGVMVPLFGSSLFFYLIAQ